MISHDTPGAAGHPPGSAKGGVMNKAGYTVRGIFSPGSFSKPVLPLLGYLLTLLMANSAIAENEVDWNRWSIHDPESVDEVQYGPLDAILRTLVIDVKGSTRMRYSVLGADKPLAYLTRYIQYMVGLPVSRLNRNEQLAYWLNLYNLGVIRMFVTDPDAYRKVKILRGEPATPGEGWSTPVFVVEGQPLSLNDIEQRILFVQWRDPLTLYGLCYGVKGSPPMGTTAFRGQEVYDQLTEIGRLFVKDNVIVKRQGVALSKLYTWNRSILFADSDRMIINHILSLADAELKSKLSPDTRLVKSQFSWRSVAFSPRRAGDTGLADSVGGGIYSGAGS